MCEVYNDKTLYQDHVFCGHTKLTTFSEEVITISFSSYPVKTFQMSLAQSPKPGQQRAALYKQSPARSPLRVMMKARFCLLFIHPWIQPLHRCQERIRAGRDAVVGNRRNLGQVTYLEEKIGKELRRIESGGGADADAGGASVFEQLKQKIHGLH